MKGRGVPPRSDAVHTAVGKTLLCFFVLAWLPLHTLAVNKKLFLFVQNSGGEKLLEFVEKCRWNIFKRPERGQIFLRSRFGSFFGFFAFFKLFFVSNSNIFGGSFVLQTCRPNLMGYRRLIARYPDNPQPLNYGGGGSPTRWGSKTL